jgi:hypothetical protein
MTIVFGAELGLTKPQLRDLGYIALFFDAGMGTIPDAVLSFLDRLHTGRGDRAGRAESVVQCGTLLQSRAA